MNETLSDEEIKTWKEWFDSLGPFVKKGGLNNNHVAYTREDMQKALNTIEALKSENEIYKELTKGFSEDSKSFLDSYVKQLGELETKDAQIKQLVEALAAFKDKYEQSDEETGSFVDVIDFENIYQKAYKTLSTLPDMEGYRLEQKVLDEELKSFGSKEHYAAIRELRAHREKVKNDA